MYHQRNVAFFAAFSTRRYDTAAVLDLLRQLLLLFPHLLPDPSEPRRSIAEETLLRLARLETLASFEGFPDCWIDEGAVVFERADLPLFRLRIGQLPDGPDAAGRQSFLLVQVCHALAEGADSALLTRSISARHPQEQVAGRTSPWVRVLARAAVAVAVPFHLVAARQRRPPPPGRVVTRAYPRQLLTALAHASGIRQRSLFMALAAHVIVGAGMPGGKARISLTYSTLGAGTRDSFMRMRMLFARLPNHPDFTGFSRALDQRLTGSEAAETGFNAEVNAGTIAAHRRLARLLPWLYGPRVFTFMPFDFVFALLPPHHPAGPLGGDLLEPVHAGAVTPGINGCVVVPGRQLVSFNFYLEERLLPQVARLDQLLLANRSAPVNVSFRIPSA